ncbi:6-phospho-beta-glucosidase [Lactococcus cremoris]|nr:6-phospho-beta-glucosidase [Lactococcus cremoris]
MNKEIRNSGETFSSGFLFIKLKIKGDKMENKMPKDFFWGNSTS